LDGPKFDVWEAIGKPWYLAGEIARDNPQAKAYPGPNALDLGFPMRLERRERGYGRHPFDPRLMPPEQVRSPVSHGLIDRPFLGF
jgi:hypothetical protein